MINISMAGKSEALGQLILLTFPAVFQLDLTRRGDQYEVGPKHFRGSILSILSKGT